MKTKNQENKMETQTELNEKIESAIESIATDQDVIAIVKGIEAGPETTQGHYADYMMLLTQYAKTSKALLYVFSQALIRAGANAYGVKWAIKILTGGN